MAQTIREKLLTLLIEHKDHFLSGQKISEKLNCSRTAVWKHITKLKKEGYHIEGVQRKGYRLISKPNNVRPHDIRANLHTEKIGQYIHYYETTASTQEIAHTLALEGAEEGTVVIAEHQSRGRGRLGRPWESAKGTGLWISLILRPPIQPYKAPQLTLLTSVAIVEAIEKTTGIQCEIKWPNDILIKQKKVVGILTELQADPDAIKSIIIGFGINVNTHTFPDHLKEIATSLKIENHNKEIQRATLAQAIFLQFELLYKEYLENGFAPIKAKWEQYATSIGKKITAHTLKKKIEGIATGITDDGILLIKDGEGVVHKVLSADIEFPSSLS